MLDYVECVSCGAKMPSEANFCGICGKLMKKRSNVEIVPIFELFEPNAFIKYYATWLHRYSSQSTYRVLKINHIIEIEWRNITLYGSGIDFLTRYKYVSRDRRYWLPASRIRKDGRPDGVGLSKRMPFERLKPVNYYTNLWIDTRGLNVGDAVMIYDQMQKVISKVNEERTFYVVGSDDEKLYFDEKTGLLWRWLVKDREFVLQYHSSWKKL